MTAPHRTIETESLKVFRCFFAEGEIGGLYACGATFQYMVPLPNFVITLLFSKMRLKRKDFQKIVRLPWAQEASGSNPDAPTNSFVTYTWWVSSPVWICATQAGGVCPPLANC